MPLEISIIGLISRHKILGGDCLRAWYLFAVWLSIFYTAGVREKTAIIQRLINKLENSDYKATTKTNTSAVYCFGLFVFFNFPEVCPQSYVIDAVWCPSVKTATAKRHHNNKWNNNNNKGNINIVYNCECFFGNNKHATVIRNAMLRILCI